MEEWDEGQGKMAMEGQLEGKLDRWKKGGRVQESVGGLGEVGSIGCRIGVRMDGCLMFEGQRRRDDHLDSCLDECGLWVYGQAVVVTLLK